MHVVVVGCGRVGSNLAASLTSAGHSVAVIDRNAESLNRLSPDFPGQRITGIGFDRDRLVEAGIERADALAAVTNGDNSNILIARAARETYGIERVVARIYDPRRAAIYERLGIPTVATVQWTTERVLRRVLGTSPSVDWIDPSANVSLLERVVPGSWAGKPVSTLEASGAIRVGALSRLGVSSIPPPDLVLQEGDVVYLMVSAVALEGLDARLAAGPNAGGHH